jgi:NAD(P)-dependent dehydrogenase (short-subunit alcohol dehydrogenase family)
MSDQWSFDLKGRVAAVVGAGSGIGEAVAIGAGALGAKVACLDVDGGKAEAVAEAIRKAGGEARAQTLDIRDGDATAKSFAGLKDEHGSLDVVISTPSINVRKKILDYSEDEFARVIDVNLKGNFNVLRAAGRVMTAQGSGSIVLFSSIRSQVIEPGQAVYAATKAGIAQLARTAAAEFAPHGVRVNALAPGVVDTPLTAPIKSKKDWYDAYSAKSILNRWASPEEIARPTLFLASDAASYMTGALLFVDGGWLAADGRFTPPGM